MDLRDRLRLLRAAGSSRPRGGPAPGATAPARSQASAAETAGPRPARVGEALQGYVRAVPSGETFYVETRYPAGHCRGPLPLAAVRSIPGPAWALLGPLPPSVEMERAIFLDTETTGLSGGSGTYAFLVGLGFFEGNQFVVRQYFLRDYPEEEALLEAAAEDLASGRVLVTFNGKAFDWPLLEERYRMHRRTPPLAGVPHLDLLHPSRRIWRERLPQCTLATLEAQILGVLRERDVPGELIPQRYFDYLRTGNAEPLDEVLEHNRLDILSLVSLAAWLGRLVTDPFSPTADGELVCGEDLFALGRLFLHRGALAEGIRCLEEARRRGVTVVSEVRLQRELAAAYKRARELGQALAIWQEMTAGAGSLTLYPYVEMAKYYEHVAHDYRAALRAARQALAVAEQRRRLAGPSSPRARRDIEELRHRLARLERKLARSRSILDGFEPPPA
ncbi:MAG TPA: ribonuclease H-like domain-containing protein [Symbiobacteriaceae bacterium]